MRRIEESRPSNRDGSDTAYSSTGKKEEHQAMRTLPSTFLSRLIIPHRLRYWAISVHIDTPRTEFSVGEPVPFAVTMKNSMPFPITLPVRSPIAWDWEVDGLIEASHVEVRNPPAETHGFRFGRGERKRYYKQWQGMFRISPTEWESAQPGEYTISAGINIDDAKEKGLYAETTVTLVP